MHKQILYAAYGWLALSGVLHFAADVLSQYLRGKRPPGIETTLYYGLNSAFSLGMVVFGLCGLFLASRAAALLRETPLLILSLVAAFGWFAIAFFFIEYWQPKANAAVICALMVSVWITR